ncbi:MAG: DUF928 domain-containing protein [Leptolyngbyaceae cyanobacterium CRU_2_3]|nr:DUF928 domain-containing protein [Leptolyngbyaceae cyanobacterium CRU_2_3]
MPILSLSLLTSFSLSAKLRAAASLPGSVASISYMPPPPPPDRGAPGNRGEGASRGCVAGSAENHSISYPLMALVPEQTLSTTSDAATTTQVWGLTSTDQPRFWFSVPYDPTKVKTIEFVLQNHQDQTIYRTLLPVPSTPGIISVQLPSTVGQLERNQPYHWFFKVRSVCESNQAATLDYVEGWIQRTQLDQGLRDRLTQATPQQQAALYAENGIWYDALTTLAELKLAQPENQAIAQDWTDLLKAVGLENLGTQPLLR